MSTSLGQQPIVMLSVAKQLGVASPHWHGRSWLWWSNLTYVLVSYAAWHDPLISKVQGSKPAICPKAKGSEGLPLCPIALSVALPVEAPRSRRWHSNFLSLSFSRSTPTPVNSGVRFIPRKLGLKWGTTLVPLTTKGGRESLVCLFTMWGRSRGVCMRVSNRQHLALNVCSVCVHALAPCAHLLVPIGSVCQGGDEEGQKDVQNNIFFPCPLWYLIEMCKPGSAWQCSLLSSRSQKERLERYRKKTQRRIKSGGRKEWETALHLSCQSLAPD